MQSRHQELAKRRADDPVAKQKVELLGERNRTEEHVKAQQAEVDRQRDAIASEERRGVELGAAGEALKQREAVEVPRARHKISLGLVGSEMCIRDRCSIERLREQYTQISYTRGSRADEPPQLVDGGKIVLRARVDRKLLHLLAVEDVPLERGVVGALVVLSLIHI